MEGTCAGRVCQRPHVVPPWTTLGIMVRSAASVTSGALLAIVVAACASSDPAPPAEPSCVSGLSTTCKPQYDPPDFATLHAKIFAPTCATGGASCHGRDGKKGGLDLSDEAKRNAGVPWGPANPQALNRYSSVLNAPVKATDPSGHCLWDLCIIEGAAVGAVIVEVVIPAVVGAVVIATAYEAGGALGRAQASQSYESRWQRRETDMGPKDVRRLKDSEVPRQAHAQKRKGNPLRADDGYFVDKEGNLYSGNDKQGELTSEGKLEDYQDE